MKPRRSNGITLIELLVVVSILVLLGAVVIPGMAPNLETRRLREAARGVDTFLAAAKARAIRNGRPVGVMITPLENNVRAALMLSLAEVPEVYAGDLYSSTARVRVEADGTLQAVTSEQLGLGDIIGQGDLIQFDQKGYFYRILSLSNNTTFTLVADKRGGVYNWPNTPFFSGPMPFKIYRAPVVYSNLFGQIGVAGGTASTFQMPEGIAIDLAGSVFPGAVVNVPDAPNNVLSPITIVFSPAGGVTAIYSNQSTRYLPAGPIHLLIGKIKNIQATEEGVPPIRNWLDTTNLYVSIGHLTGQITTTEVAPVSGATTLQEQLIQATAFTRDTYATGGR